MQGCGGQPSGTFREGARGTPASAAVVFAPQRSGGMSENITGSEESVAIRFDSEDGPLPETKLSAAKPPGTVRGQKSRTPSSSTPCSPLPLPPDAMLGVGLAEAFGVPLFLSSHACAAECLGPTLNLGGGGGDRVKGSTFLSIYGPPL